MEDYDSSSSSGCSAAENQDLVEQMQPQFLKLLEESPPQPRSRRQSVQLSDSQFYEWIPPAKSQGSMPLLFVRENTYDDELEHIALELHRNFVEQDRYELESRYKKRKVASFMKGERRSSVSHEAKGRTRWVEMLEIQFERFPHQIL